MEKKKDIYEIFFSVVAILALILLTIGAFVSENKKQNISDYTENLMEQSIQLQQEQIEILKNLEVKIK